MSEKFYVIRDKEGNFIVSGDFITPTETEQGWHYLKLEKEYVEDTLEFTYYSNKETAEKEIGYLKSLGYDFHLEYIDIKSMGMCKNEVV